MVGILTKILPAFFLSCAFFFAAPVFAAELRLDTHQSEMTFGESFLVDIVMHAEESLNAIEGRLVFPKDLLSVKEIRDGNSVINFWIEKPHVEVPGVVLFSGMTPGGWSGANNHIFSIIFEAKNTGVAAVALQNTKAWMNDGRGTETTLRIHDTAMAIKSGDNPVRKEMFVDTASPEFFTPVIGNDPNVFDGKYFLVFVTQDKISGVDRYEVREGSWDWFRVAESPYLLKHQSLNRKIFVKAVDHAGNERMVVLPAQQHSSRYRLYGIFGILFMIVLVGCYVKKVWPKFIR